MSSLIKEFSAIRSVIRWFLVLCACLGPTHALGQRPNILLVIADDMGIDASPCYSVGDEKPAMPVLEELCRTGVVFENVWANPECSPTRATILTGRYGIRTGVRSAVPESGGKGIRLDELSIQRQLDEHLNARYAHAVIGKWHLSGENNGGPDNPELMGIGHYSGLVDGYGHADYWKWNRTQKGETKLVEGYSTSVFTDEAIAWIKKQHKPWFLWLAYTAPHGPFHLPPASLHTRRDLDGSVLDIVDQPLPYYLAMLEALDSELGRLLSTLSAKQRDNTTVIFVGDNGTPGEVVQPPYYKFKAKSTIFEGGIHVPLVVAGGGVARKGERERALVNTTDIFATVSDLAGTGLTQLGDSLSFKHLLAGTAGPLRKHIYAEYHDEHHAWKNAWAIRDNQYKLIQFESGTKMLFDVTKDPSEARNLLDYDPSAEILAVADTLASAASAIRKD